MPTRPKREIRVNLLLSDAESAELTRLKHQLEREQKQRLTVSDVIRHAIAELKQARQNR